MLTGMAPPTLEALIRLAKASHLSLDTVVFDEAKQAVTLRQKTQRYMLGDANRKRPDLITTASEA